MNNARQIASQPTLSSESTGNKIKTRKEVLHNNTN